MFLQIEGFQTYSNILSNTKGPLPKNDKADKESTFLCLPYITL